MAVIPFDANNYRGFPDLSVAMGKDPESSIVFHPFTPRHVLAMRPTEFDYSWVPNDRDRPQVWRVLHCIALEASAVGVTCPLIVALTPLGWTEALVAEFGLTLVYAVYGYLFYLGFDRLRPVRARASRYNLTGPERPRPGSSS